MKRLYGFLSVVVFLFVSVSYAQTVTPPPGEKENPFEKEYEKQGKKAPATAQDSFLQSTNINPAPRVPATIDSSEMKFLAEYIQDLNISIGVFDLPGEEDRMRSMKNGKYPEEDSIYLDVAIRQNIVKFYTADGIKGSFDSLIFVKLPAMQQEHDHQMTFYPYPSTKWLLFIEKGIVTADGKVRTRDWVDKLKGGYASYSFVSDQTAFYFANAHYANYYLKWSNEPIPNGVVKVDDAFVSDVKDIVAFLSTIPAGTDKKTFDSKIETLKSKLRTDKAKYLCVYLDPK